MKTHAGDKKTQTLQGLLNEARAEADGLRKRLKKAERILLSTRLIMGHELKRPTTAINGYLDLAIEELGEATQKKINELIEKARGECELLNELNLFFLELLKVERTHEELTGTRLDMHEFLEEIIDHLPEILKARERVQVSVSSKMPDFHGNQKGSKIILSNIIENALIYSPEDSPVRIEVEKSVDKRGMSNLDLIKIRIIDEGVGIPREYIKQIFNPFVRLRADVSEGSGLGLTLVRSLVELYGGSIYIRSEEGSGTTVYLTLPDNRIKGENGGG
jgi:signal transduction histidine kinase